MKKNHIIIIAAVVVLFAALSYVTYSYSKKPLSFVSISINPDVELAVNDNNIVKEVLPVNGDADIITSDLDLVGKTVEEASDSIIDAAIDTGYIDEYSEDNTVVVTVTDEDETIRSELEERVMNRLNAHFETRKVYPVLVANGLNDTLKAEATQYEISNGKMLLVDRAAIVNPDYTKEELSKMSVKEIQQVIKDYVKERHDALKITKEELKDKWQSEKATLKATYQSKVATLKDNLLKDAGINTDGMTAADKNKEAAKVLEAKKDEILTNVNKVKEELKNSVQTGSNTVKEKIKSIREKIRQNRNQ